MTRAAAPDAAFEHRSFGAPGAERTVVVLRTGTATLSDPQPDVTARRDVRILAVALTVDDIDDPAAYRGTTPAEATADAIAQFIAGEGRHAPIALVGVGAAGELAILIAARLGAGVDRLTLVAVPQPESELGGHEVAEMLGAIEARTLVMNAATDPDAAAAAARWFRDRLSAARVEMVPGTSDPEGRLILADVWERVLSHAAPGTVR